MNGSNTQTLGYDALDRLTSVASGLETASYTYDADGNRTHQVPTARPPPSRTRRPATG
jgi:YD repeat-containing protein